MNNKRKPNEIRTEASGARIRQARELAGMTNQKVAIRMGKGKGTISRWESGLVSPNIEQYIELAQLFGVKCSWLMAMEMVDGEPNDPLVEAVALIEDVIRAGQRRRGYRFDEPEIAEEEES
jgi:transcriptional regulator with XRE-family HTH domain